MEQVSPTRTELLTRKAQIQLATQGAQLLRNKREALVREFLSELSRFRDARNAMMRALAEATQALLRSYSIDGEHRVRSAGLAARRPIEVEATERNIWGTRITEVESDYAPGEFGDHPFLPAGEATSVRIDEATEHFETTLEHIIKVAPIDRKLRRLADEIRKTSRRVNALEQKLLPGLEEQVDYIRAVLDQREREDVFRLKRLKKKR